MSRSPLAYPLSRGIDGDGGGAADLQTDIMRFMAILALCLVAIFALVQSIPLAPVPVASATEPAAAPVPDPAKPEITQSAAPAAPAADRDEPVLTRPQWKPEFPAEKDAPQRVTGVAARPPAEPAPAKPVPIKPATAAPPPAASAPAVRDVEPVAPGPRGFTLSFASDLALTRLVAQGKVGFYAILPGRARRMTVSDSRPSFWDASMPNTFHEMEAATVPHAVVDALSRAGGDVDGARWAVTLPRQLSDDLERLMQAHDGGSLVITLSGDLVREDG